MHNNPIQRLSHNSNHRTTGKILVNLFLHFSSSVCILGCGWI
ncbi:unnamed protein product [Linum tenue]|uniref:Uncharacterized protein n=1 Tax=Linum tenue TaxID=586396 RepID=A0AAV0R1V3_9ROSI|nr:unnamed protein product [Linum tenue]